ncbi:hypothetical protein BKA24_001658 [Microbacterium marinum]|uniref:Uncharacterized protein n=1 Tax=Microbacterium marinum TaxID=421115 RepID=A0A7W7BSN4_9MICO|nr:hypothetical protein [Microbacterium marinum]MBB4666949.1 hypothetical protein [Microbacterium marinum]
MNRKRKSGRRATYQAVLKPRAARRGANLGLASGAEILASIVVRDLFGWGRR